jgi:hypothetical protein
MDMFLVENWITVFLEDRELSRVCFSYFVGWILVHWVYMSVFPGIQYLIHDDF